MSPSMIKILMALGIERPVAETIRDEINAFLMSSNGNDREKISQLDREELAKLAKGFVALRGESYFSSSSNASLVWPEDATQLAGQVQRVMYKQIMAKYYRRKAAQVVRSGRERSVSESDSEGERQRQSSRKRLRTEASETWSPGGAQGDSPEPRTYATRSMAQPGMPVLQSIERGNNEDAENPRGNKNRNVNNSQISHRWRAVNSTPQARQSMVPQANVGNRGVAERTIGVNIPLHRKPTRPPELATNSVAMNAAAECMATPAGPCESDSEENVRGRRRPISLTGLKAVDEFIVENGLHLSSTPEPQRTPEPAITPVQCEPTPPPSSSINGDIFSDPFPDLSNNTLPNADTDQKVSTAWVPPWSQSSFATIDLTAADLVEIQTGENQFRIVNRERAPRVLQKLVDILVDELKICRRNARQARIDQQKQTWEMKTDHLHSVIMAIQANDELWQGGGLCDRSLEML